MADQLPCKYCGHYAIMCDDLIESLNEEIAELKADLAKATANHAADLSAAPEEGTPKLAEWISPEPTPAMLEAVASILQPYAAKLVWARMLKAALTMNNGG